MTHSRTLRAPDGTLISYEIAGSGPALVLTNGLTTTSRFWKYLRPMWLGRHTVITWELPGHGASSRALTEHGATIAAQPGIVAAIMDAEDIASATQIGFSVGCQIVLEMYKQFPERCDALVMLLGPAGRVLDTTALPLNGPTLLRLLRHTPPALFARLYRAFARASTLPGSRHIVQLLGLAGARTTAQDIRDAVRDMGAVDPLSVQKLGCSAQAHSAHDALPRLNVPMLIVAGENDPFAVMELVGVPMHKAAPDSELVRLPKGTHTALLEDAAAIASAVDDFIGRRARASRGQRAPTVEA